MYSAIEHSVNMALYKCCILLLLLFFLSSLSSWHQESGYVYLSPKYKQSHITLDKIIVDIIYVYITISHQRMKKKFEVNSKKVRETPTTHQM